MKRTNQQNTDDIRALLASHQKHLLIANKEMGDVKKEMETVKDDISSIKYDVAITKENVGWLRESMNDAKKALENFDNRTWAILATIVIGFLASLYFK